MKSKWILLLNLILLFIYFFYSVAGKEKLLSEGELVLLELAPVDPRSLMQGDYMRLNYQIATEYQEDSIPKRGYIVVELDKNQVAKPLRVQSGKEPLKSSEHLINYTSSNWRINIGAESYFFEEGQATKFDSARYGGLKINRNGNSLLIGLYDKDLNLIK